MTTTCKPCGSVFGGRAEHCCVCHETFSGTTAGDMHQVGDHAVFHGPNRRRCLTVGEMLAKGMSCTKNAQGTPLWSRGDAGYRSGVAPKHPYSHAGDATDGLAAQEWASVPLVLFSARKSEVAR